jgi:hypothetical protein
MGTRDEILGAGKGTEVKNLLVILNHSLKSIVYLCKDKTRML